MRNFYKQVFYRTPLVAAPVRINYNSNSQLMSLPVIQVIHSSCSWQHLNFSCSWQHLNFHPNTSQSAVHVTNYCIHESGCLDLPKQNQHNYFSMWIYYSKWNINLLLFTCTLYFEIVCPKLKTKTLSLTKIWSALKFTDSRATLSIWFLYCFTWSQSNYC